MGLQRKAMESHRNHYDVRGWEEIDMKLADSSRRVLQHLSRERRGDEGGESERERDEEERRRGREEEGRRERRKYEGRGRREMRKRRERGGREMRREERSKRSTPPSRSPPRLHWPCRCRTRGRSPWRRWSGAARSLREGGHCHATAALRHTRHVQTHIITITTTTTHTHTHTEFQTGMQFPTFAGLPCHTFWICIISVEDDRVLMRAEHLGAEPNCVRAPPDTQSQHTSLVLREV